MIPRPRDPVPAASRTRRLAAATLLLVSLLLSTAAFAQAANDPAPLLFGNVAEERRFHALVSELRCVMCQNQSLADSNAMIAQDLRLEVLQLMRDGNSDARIKTFLVERYTDFVLYKPELKPHTWLLWFGPGLLLLGGAVAIIVIVRKQKGTGAMPPRDQEQEW